MKLHFLNEQIPQADLAGQPLDKTPVPATDQTSTKPSEAPSTEQAKAERTIKAIEKLQDAAVGLEAARFTLQQEYSDFSLAKKLEILKQELVDVIGKSKEHVMQSSAKSPDAEKLVSKWLNL